MLRKIIFILIHCSCLYSFGQNNTLSFQIDTTQNSVQVDKLQAYLGNFEFSYENNESVQISEYRLINWKNKPELHFNEVNLDKVTSLSFDIGVDSTQTLQGAMVGDLDPGKGMFWTWQSGYINFKLEYMETGVEKTFHIGGYKSYQNSVKRVTLDIPQGKRLSGISFDLKAFITFVNKNNMSKVMSPGDKAMMIARHYKHFISQVLDEATH